MILVSDTSVLIDLDRSGLLEAVFVLPHAFAVPDVLYDRELQGEWGEQLRRLGLRVEEVSEAGVGNALGYRRQRASLSVPDSFALALAKERAWLLLTGDNALRELAASENVECHGVLWLGWTNWRKPARRAFNFCMTGCLSWLHIHDAACRRAKLRSGWSGIK
jgi:hypothetical protein